MKNTVRIIKALATFSFVVFAAWGVAVDVFPTLTHRMDDFPIDRFAIERARDLPNRRTQFIADEIIQTDMPILPLNATMPLGPLPTGALKIEVSFLLHIKPQIEFGIAFKDGDKALICRFSSIPNPKTLSIIQKDDTDAIAFHTMELPQHVHVGERVLMRAIKTPGAFQLYAGDRIVASVQSISPKPTEISLTTGSTPTQIDNLSIESKGPHDDIIWAWRQSKGKAYFNSATSAIVLLLFLLAPILEVLFLRWLLRGALLDSILIAAFAWMIFPIAHLVRVPWPPFMDNYPLQAVALGFIALQALGILIFLPRPKGLAPPSDPPPFFELMAQGGRFDRWSKAAIFYELIGLVFVGIFVYRDAPTPVLLLAVFALFGPGSTVTVAALAWKTPTRRMIPLAYPLFIPALILIGYACFFEPGVQHWAPVAGTLIAGGFIIASSVGLRFRKGSHYWLPALALSLGLTIFVGETAARLALPELTAELRLDSVYSGDWRIDRYTNFLGNNGDLAQIPTATGSVPAKKAEGVRRIVCLGTSTTAPGRIEEVYPQRLERILNEISPGAFQVLNGGMAGADDLQLFIYLRDILMQSSPDLILYYFGRLDPEPEETRESYRRIKSIIDELSDADATRRAEAVAAGSTSMGAIIWHRISKRLTLAAAARRAFKQAREARAHLRLEANGSPAIRQRQDIDPSIEQVLMQMANLCRQKGATFIMIPQITRNAEFSDGLYAHIMTENEGQDRAVYMDLREEFSNSISNNLFYEFTYMNAEGHDFMAQVLAKKLMPFLVKTETKTSSEYS